MVGAVEQVRVLESMLGGWVEGVLFWIDKKVVPIDDLVFGMGRVLGGIRAVFEIGPDVEALISGAFAGQLFPQ